jgi:NSS family neurotransmitter:Na+ symporter
VTVDSIFLGLYDGLAYGILLVLGSLLLALFVGWVVPGVGREELRKGMGDAAGFDGAWIWVVRLPLVFVIFVSLVLGVTDYVGFLTGGFADWLAAR